MIRVRIGNGRLYLLLFLFLSLPTPPSQAGVDQDKTESQASADFLPTETLLYLEVKNPEQLVQKLLQHPTVSDALELDAVKPNLRDPQFLAFKAGLTLVEATLGAEWPGLVADLSGNGLVIAALPGENRFVALLHARDEGRLKKAAESLLNLSSMDARNNGRPAPWRIEERGTAKIAIFDGFAMVRQGVRLALATRVDDAEAILKRLTDENRADENRANTLAADTNFKAAHQQANHDHDIFLWTNLDKIRATGAVPALTQTVSDNPAAELILGGLLSALGTNASATTTLHLTDAGLRIEAATAYQPALAAGSREYWFGPNGTGAAPDWVPADALRDSTVMQLSSYRDLGQWWLNKELLFTDAVIADLVQADSQLSTVFGGLDFGGEVLGAFQPGVQILVSGRPGTNIDPATEQNAGGLQIPGFAIVGQLREPRQMTRRFKVAFQSVMGFVNLGLAQSGLPQYDVDTRTIESGCECLSRIWVEEEADLQSPVYSFSPSLIIKEGRFVLGSDAAWVQQLSDSPASPSTEAGKVGEENRPGQTPIVNTQLQLDWQLVVALLRLNRETLVAQNMIENGNDPTTAGREVDHFLQALELISRIEMKLETDAEQMKLIGQLNFKNSTRLGERR